MATVTSLGFNIFSKYNNKGVNAAKRDLDSLARKRPTVTVSVKTDKALADLERVFKKVSELARKSASIRISTSTAKARADIDKLSAKVTALSKKSASIRVRANTAEATTKLDKLAAKTRALDDKTIRVHVRVDEALAAIDRVGARLRSLNNHDIRIKVKLDFSDFGALNRLMMAFSQRAIHIPVRVEQDPINRLIGGIRRAGDESETAGRRMRSSFGRSNTGMRQLAKSFDVMHGQFLAWIRIGLLAGPAVAGAIGVASVAIVQATSALAIAAAGTGVFALALRNVANIAGSQVAVQITRAKAAVNSFGTGSAHILGQVMVHAVNALINILHAIEPAVRPVSRVFLSIAKDIENFTKSPALKAFTGWFKVMAPAAITSLWGTFKAFAEGMYHFLARIGAFNGQVFLDWLNRCANAFNRWSQGDGPMRLKRFFDQWGPAIAQCARGLLQLAFAMGKAMNPVVIVLVRWLGQFSMWLGKLIEQHPILGQVIAGVILGYRLLSVAVAVTNHVMDLLNSRLVRNTAAWIANKAQILASKAAYAGRWLLNAAEFLSIQTANLVRNTGAWIANKAQILASKAVSIASSILAAAGALAVQTAALVRNAALWTVQKIALIASRGVMIAIRAVTLAWAAAQWLLNAALAANPIGLVVIAIAALVAGLILAYRHSQTFRNIVNSAWNVVKIGALAMWNVLKIVFHGLVSGFSNAGGWATKFKNWIIGAFNAIRGGVVNIWGGMWGHVRSAFNAAWAAIRGTFNVMRGWIVGAFNAIRGSSGSIWSGMWAHIRGAFNAAWGAIRGTFNVMRTWIVGAFNAIRGGAGSIWAGMWNRIRGAFNAAWGAIRGTFNVMRGWIIGAFNAIRGGAGSIWAGMWNRIRGAFNVAWGAIRGTLSVMGQWIANKFHSIHNSIGGWWSRAWNWIRGTFNAAWGRIRGTLSVMGQWIANKFHSIHNSIGSWWSKAWNWIRGVFNSAWGRIRGSMSVMGQWMGNKFHAIHNSIGSWWNKAWTWIRNIFNFAWGKLRASLGLMGQWMGNKFHAIRNSIGSWWNKAWTWIRNIFNFAWGKVRGSMGVMGQWMGNKFHAIYNSLTSWWNKMWSRIRAIFNWTWGKLRGSMYVMAGTMGRIWKSIVRAAGSIWEGIKKVVARPINFVIGFVADRLIPFANKALRAVLGKKAPQINGGGLKGFKIPGYADGGVVDGYAGGGVLPGYTPGRDIHIAQSPMGPIGLSGGEGILRPEVMRAPGMKDFLHGMNSVAKKGGISGVKAKMSKSFRQSRDTNPPAEGAMFANGGIVGGVPTVANFDGGGLFDKIKNIAKFVIPGFGAADTAKKFIQEKGFGAVLQKVFGKVYDAARNWLRDVGPVGQLVGGTMAKVVSSIVSWVSGKVNPATDGNWTVTGKGLQNAINFAKSQDGKPYQWGGGGNPSYDCSGFMASIERVMTGRGPGRLYTTHQFRGASAPRGWKQNADSPFRVGVTSAGVGHMAGTLAGTAVESSGSHGVQYGPPARSADHPMFKWRYGYMPATSMARKGGSAGGPNNYGGIGGTLASMGFGGGAGGGRAYFTHFWDGRTASGKPMSRTTIASSYIPLGSILTVSKGGKSSVGTVDDLGPAKFVYQRHPGIAVLDLAEGMLPGDGYGTFRINKVGTGRTLYGKNLRGYAKGGTIGSTKPAIVGERGPELAISHRGGSDILKSGTKVSIGDTHIHFHDKVYAKSEREFEQMVITAVSEARRKKKF